MKNSFEFIKASERLKEETLKRAKSESEKELFTDSKTVSKKRLISSLIAACMTVVTGLGVLTATGVFKGTVTPSPTPYAEILYEYDNIYTCLVGNGKISPSANESNLFGFKINDNAAYKSFIAKYRFSSSSLADRIKVSVLGEDSLPVFGATVKALSDKNEVLFTAKTDNKGCAYLFAENTDSIFVSDGKTAATYKKTGNEMTVTLAESRKQAEADIMFMLDQNSSESGIPDYLKEFLPACFSECPLDTRFAASFFGETATSFTSSEGEFQSHFSAASSQNGIDESIEAAVNNALWRDGSVKLLFLVFDSYVPQSEAFRRAVLTAAEKGIRIIPVFYGKTDTEDIDLLRSCAVLTGGESVFLCSSNGSSKIPDALSVKIKPLKQLISEIISDYTE